MRVCSHCEGFVPEANNQCPNCETSIAPLKKKGKLSKILYGITVGSTAMTLMACYGQPPSGCNQKCGSKNEEITNCRKKCSEENRKTDLIMFYILTEQAKSKNQTNKTQTSSTSNSTSTVNEVDTNSELPPIP